MLIGGLGLNGVFFSEEEKKEHATSLFRKGGGGIGRFLAAERTVGAITPQENAGSREIRSGYNVTSNF